METLTPSECRVLGVLIEKAHTVASQYPMSINALVTGSNQKNNRYPVLNLSEEQVVRAVQGLRAKGHVAEVQMTGSRVAKFRHLIRESLGLTTSQVVVLAELLLRGPQSVGELRGRASRMHPLESLEVVQNILDSLMGREGPLVQRIEPAPGERAVRFAQLLCPELHPLHGPPAESPPDASEPPPPGLGERVERLEAQVAELQAVIGRLAQSLGEPPPFAGTEVDGRAGETA